MCAMHWRILDFSPFLKPVRHSLKHMLLMLTFGQRSATKWSIQHSFLRLQLAHIQIRCLLINQANWSRIDGYCVCPMNVWRARWDAKILSEAAQSAWWIQRIGGMGGSEKSIFMEEQCFLRSHSVSAAFPSGMALRGQCQAGGWFSTAAALDTRVEWHQLRGVNAICPAFCSLPEVIVSSTPTGRRGDGETVGRKSFTLFI